MPIWEGLTSVVIASGPSLCADDIALVKNSEIKTIAVNSTCGVVPWCDVLFAGDCAWWGHNKHLTNIAAEKWTCSKAAASAHGLNFRENKIPNGYNSGACAVELAANVFLANTVLMLGFDCSIKNGLHHHGAHKKTANPTIHRCEIWKKQFNHLVKICNRSRLINCSRYTEIDCIERKGLEEALCELGLI